MTPRTGTESDERKEWVEMPVRRSDAGLYVADGWQVTGDPWLDAGVEMLMVKKKISGC